MEKKNRKNKKPQGTRVHIPGVPGDNLDESSSQKRYESDLTPKEKRQLEWQKISSLGFQAKAEYIWNYYKLHIAGIILGILAIIGVVNWIERLRYEDILCVTVVNAINDTTQLAADFKEYLGDDDQYHQINFDASIQVGDVDEMDYTMTMKMTVLVGAGSMDILVGDEQFLRHYEEQDMFYKLSEVLDDDLYEAVQDDMLDDYILEIGGSERWLSYEMVYYDPIYVAVVASGKNPDTAVEFIRWLATDQPCALSSESGTGAETGGETDAAGQTDTVAQTEETEEADTAAQTEGTSEADTAAQTEEASETDTSAQTAM